MRTPRLSPAAYRRVTFVAALLVAAIIVTGAAVRLTDSGLGCPTWPNCSAGHLVAQPSADSHAVIEQVNRLFTGLVSVGVIVAVLGSLWRVPRRRALVWLSAGLVGGVVAQAVLGGMVVLFDLRPVFVMAHFLLSIALLADAIVLHWRAGQPDEPARAVVTPRTILLGRVLLGLVAIVLFTGTLVTGAGPHSGGGTHRNIARIDVPIDDVARLHGTMVMVFLALVLGMLWLVRHDRAPLAVQTRVSVVLALLVAQGTVGYVQYFNGIPAWLVGIHVAGATAVFAATLWFYLGLFVCRPPGIEDPTSLGVTPAALASPGVPVRR
jgi:cytochrome c oxidase assembly protein subunit 15